MLEWACPADWAFILGWRQKGLNASMGMHLFWGLASGPASPFFKPYQVLFYFSCYHHFIAAFDLLSACYDVDLFVFLLRYLICVGQLREAK